MKLRRIIQIEIDAVGFSFELIFKRLEYRKKLVQSPGKQVSTVNLLNFQYILQQSFEKVIVTQVIAAEIKEIGDW